MKKPYEICILIFSILLVISACSNKKSSEKLANYIQGKGYEILSTEDKIDTYILTKEKLTTFPYDVIWGLQKVDAKDYIGKEINVSNFTVKKHPLDEAKNNEKHQTKVWLLVANNEVIGGYSFPYATIFGSVYSLDGKTLEEITGMSLNQWSDMWKKSTSK